MGLLKIFSGVNLLFLWVGFGMVAHETYIHKHQRIPSTKTALALFYGGLIALGIVLLQGRGDGRD